MPVGRPGSSLCNSVQLFAGRQTFASHTALPQCEENRHATQLPVDGSQYGVAPPQSVSETHRVDASGCVPVLDAPHPATARAANIHRIRRFYPVA
jgi:hypothetical protein